MIIKLEKVTINAALPLKAARRDAVAKLKSFWRVESELQTNSMPFYVDSLWGATLMPNAAWRRTRIKIPGPILSRLWTKVNEIMRSSKKAENRSFWDPDF